jgi:hypothetical protein
MPVLPSRCFAIAVAACLTTPLCAQVAVWTNHNDNANTGANLAETALNTSNVNVSSFGKLFTYSVDASIYAQPLYLPGVNIAGKGVHNVVYVATMNDSVYAFDADSNDGANATALWSVNFTDPARGITPVPSTDVQSVSDISGPIGILSTPVIDRNTGTMYVLARTKENGKYVQKLHALDVASGAEKLGGPVTIQASVAGTGSASSGGRISFDGKVQNQRPALKLANGRVYIAWASHNDNGSYHGWIIAYNASTLHQDAAFVTTPSGRLGGIWQSGQGVSIDASGNILAVVGNGDWDGSTNFGQSVIKLSPTLSLLDWFTPDNWSATNASDLDLGSTGLMLIPNTKLGITASKSSAFYLVDTSNLGRMQPGNTQIVQTQRPFPEHVHGSAVYWNSPNRGPLVYFWAENDYLKAFHYNGAKFDLTPASQSAVKGPDGMPGAMLSISANGSASGTGIVWASMPISLNANNAVVPGILRALDASDLSRELWNSQQNATRDSVGNFPKFAPPTIANGKVYLGSFSNRLTVYGSLSASSDFSLSASPAQQSVAPSQSVQYTVTVNPLNGFNGTVAFSVSGLPAGVTSDFNPVTVGGSGTTTLTIATTAGAPIGSYPLTIQGASGSTTHSTGVNLSIAQPTNFSVALRPSARTMSPGGTTSYSVDIGAPTAFNTDVAFSVSGLPAGASSQFVPDTRAGTGTVILLITAADTAAKGSYNLTVTATSAGFSRSAPATLTIADAFNGTIADLGGAFNIDGISPDNATLDGNLDGLGNTFSAELITDALAYNGVPYATGPKQAGQKNVVQAVGQTIALPRGNYVAVRFLAVATNGPQSGAFQLNYASGSASAATLKFTDWFNLPQNAEDVVLAMSHRNTPTGPDKRLFYLFGYGLAVDGTRTLTGITLPNNSNIKILAVTLIPSTVTSSDFALGTSPASKTITAGGSAAYSVTVSSQGGFAGTVALSASGLPANATAAFTPQTISGSGTATMTVSSTAAAAAGTYTITVRGAAGTLSHTATVTLGITAATAGSTLAAGPAARTTSPGGSTSYIVTRAGSGGTVTLSAGGLPQGATAVFLPPTIAVSGASVMTVNTTTAAGLGTYNVAIGDTSGTLSPTSVSLALTGERSSVPVDLSGLFNADGFSNDSAPSDGNLDGLGYSYSAALVPTTIVFNGVRYTTGPKANGQANVIRANAQTINLTNIPASAINFLGTGINGDQSGVFRVNYTDGTHSDVTIAMTDWFYLPRHSEDIVLAMDHRNGPGGADRRIFYLFGYSIPADPNRRVASLGLPANGNIVVASVTALSTSSVTATVDLSAQFNQDGMSYDANTRDGDLDGWANTLSADLLPDPLVANGVTYDIGPKSDGSMNIVQATGQSIPLSRGSYHALKIAAVAVNGNQTGVFRVLYTDGTFTDTTVSMTDWVFPPNFGEPVVLTMNHRNNAVGFDNQTYRIFQYSVAVDPGKTLSAVQFPSKPNMKVIAATLQ